MVKPVDNLGKWPTNPNENCPYGPVHLIRASFGCVAGLSKRQFDDWSATFSVDEDLILAVGVGGQL